MEKRLAGCPAPVAVVAVAIVILGLAPLARGAAEEVPFRGVPLSVDDNRGLLVPCAAAGQTVMLLLDTGATHSSLRPDVARELGLAEAGDALVDAVGATRRVPVARLPSLAVGDVTVFDLPVLVFDPALDRGAGPRVDGVLGQDVLARFNYSLDLRRRRLVIEMGDELEGRVRGTPVPFFRIGDRLVVETVLNGAGRRVGLALDSGASHLVLFDRRGGGGLDGIEAGPPTRLTTHAGTLVARAARVRLLEAGPWRAHQVAGVIVETATRDEGGLLPLVLFDEVYVNNRLGWIVFNPGWDARGRQPGRQVAGIPAAGSDGNR